MDITKAITFMTTWLENVHVESARGRIDAAYADHASRQPAPALSPAYAPSERLCLHEAAHGVVALKSGLRVDRVSTYADGTGSAQGEVDADNQCAFILARLAGPAAELILGSSVRSALAHSSDILSARLAIDAYLPPTPARVFAIGVLCAVSEHRAAITRVAAALRALGELDGPTIAALCGRAQ